MGVCEVLCKCVCVYLCVMRTYSLRTTCVLRLLWEAKGWRHWPLRQPPAACVCPLACASSGQRPRG